MGCYRSGTPLLYALVNQHPKIAIMYEGDTLALPLAAPSADRWPRWQERAELWNKLFTRHRLAPAELESSRNLSGLYRAFAVHRGALFYGEKSPAYGRWLPKVLRHFPDARFIIVIRELSEIYQSIRDAGSQGSRFFKRRGQLPRLLWSRRAMLRDVRRLEMSSVPVLFVRYREAVADTPGVARRVCDFLGLEFDAAMGSLAGADLSAIYRAPHHERVRSKRILRRVEGRAPLSQRQQRDLRMFGQASGQPPFLPSENLPGFSLGQRLRYYPYLALGCVLCGLDDLKRLLYEFLPASWFVSYRRQRSQATVDAVRDSPAPVPGRR